VVSCEAAFSDLFWCCLIWLCVVVAPHHQSVSPGQQIVNVHHFTRVAMTRIAAIVWNRYFCMLNLSVWSVCSSNSDRLHCSDLDEDIWNNWMKLKFNNTRDRFELQITSISLIWENCRT
jgi:hypothetical protein